MHFLNPFSLCGDCVSQAHSQLLCVTNRRRGVLQVATAAGTSSTDYDASVLLQPPLVSSVVPWVWSTTSSTTLEITGER
jgi:hypothetical protein